jgi:hypothetical protein
MMEKQSNKCQKTQAKMASGQQPEARFRHYWGVLWSRKKIVLGGFLMMLHLWSIYSISDAATIHVAMNGNDTNPGTTAELVATVRKAFELVWDKVENPDFIGEEPSEIVIHQGVYPGDVSVGNNEARLGGARPHLLIRAAQNPDGTFQQVIFDGGRKIGTAEPVPGKSGVFKVPGRHSYHYRTHIWEADTRIRYTMVADLAAVERFPASFWHSNSEVFFHTSDNQPPEAHDIGISRCSNGITLWRHNVTVRGLQFRNFLAWRWSCGVELRGANTTAEDCRVWNSVRGFQIMFTSFTNAFGLWLEPEGTRIIRCRTDDCGGGVYSQGKRAVIEECRLYKIRDRFIVPCYPQDDTGIQFYSPADEGEMRRNMFATLTNAFGLWCVGFCNGIFVKCKTSEFIVEHNTCLDGITFGMGCTSWHPKSICRYNIIAEFSYPILGYDSLMPTNIVDWNCLWDSQDQDMQKFLQAPRETGTGKHSIIADPRFAAPAPHLSVGVGDYRLLPDSPCANMLPEGKTCGALGPVSPDFEDVQPPKVEVTAAHKTKSLVNEVNSPAQRIASPVRTYLERDAWLGDAPNLRRKHLEEEGGEWVTSQDIVALEIRAYDYISQPTQMQIRIGDNAWSNPEPFQQQKKIQLPQDGQVTVVGVKVCDVAENWSEPISLMFRQADRGPQLKGAPVLYTNANGAVISFETETQCFAKVEFGEDKSYGTTFELPPNMQQKWVTSKGKSHVTNYAVLLTPLVKSGTTYHYRLILADENGNQTVTDDGLFTLKGEPKSYFVSPTGENVDGGGSPQKPWRTIQFAVDRALPGDRIILLPGLYPGESTLTHGGLEDAPITIEAQQPGTAILDGRSEANVCLHLEKAPHVVIKGLEVRWFGRADTFYSDDKAGIFLADSAHVSILK